MSRMRNHLVLLMVISTVLFLVVAAQQSAEDDQARASQVFEELQAAPYTEWAFQPGVPEGYYVGIEPHGMILRVFVNDVAAGDVSGGATQFSNGAILVKENHMPEGVDISGLEQQAPVEGFSGALDALTFMVKVDGYNAEAGDWFWAKTAADGTVQAAGKVEGCIGCHSQVADNDFVFNSQLGN